MGRQPEGRSEHILLDARDADDVHYAEEVKVRDQRAEVRSQKYLPSSIFYLLSLFFFGCGLMSKTMVVTLPFILLLVDWWPLRRFQLATKNSSLRTLFPLFLEKLPFLAASFMCGLLTLRAEKGVGAMHAISDIPALDRVANAILGSGRYLIQMVWPSGLAVFYPYPRAFSLWAVLGTGLVLLLGSAVILWAGRRRPYLTFGWIWYCVTLLPVVGLIQVGSHSHADRYTYVPLIGVIVMLGWGACDATKRWPRQATAVSAVGAIVLLLLLLLTRRQLSYWQDSEHTIPPHARCDGAQLLCPQQFWAGPAAEGASRRGNIPIQAGAGRPARLFQAPQ